MGARTVHCDRPPRVTGSIVAIVAESSILVKGPVSSDVLHPCSKLLLQVSCLEGDCATGARSGPFLPFSRGPNH